MLAKLKTSILIIFAMLVLAYITSPWWLVSIANSYVADELSNFQAEVDYPKFTQFKIQAIQFDLPSSGVQVELSNLTTNYSMTEIKVAAVSINGLTEQLDLAAVEQQKIEPAANPLAVSFDLINLIFEDLGVIESIKGLTIEKLTYSSASEVSSSSNVIVLENLSLHQLQGRLEINATSLHLPKRFQDLVSVDKYKNPITVNLQLDPSDESIAGRWQTKDFTLASLHYQKELAKETINFQLRSDLLQPLFSSTIAENLTFKNEHLSVNIEKEIATNQINLSSQAEINISHQEFNQWVELSESENNSNNIMYAVSTPNDIESKVDFKVRLGEQIHCLIETACGLSLSIMFQGPVVLNSTFGKIEMVDLAMNFDSSFTTENLLSSDAIFNFEQSLAKLSAGNVVWEQPDGRSFAKINPSENSTQTSLKLTELGIQVKPMFMQAPLADILDRYWSLQANVRSSKLESLSLFTEAANSASQTDNDWVRFIAESGLKAEFEINNQKTITTSGQLIIPKLDIDSSYGTAKGSSTFAWQEVDEALKLGAAQAELILTTPKVSEFTFDTALVSANLQPAENALDGSISLSFNQIPMSPIEFKYNKSDKSTSLVFAKEEVNIDMVNHLLSIVGEQQNIPLQILSGSLTHSGDVLLAKSALLSSQLDADKITVLFGENKVKGLKLNQLVTSVSPKLFQSDLKIESIDFSSGLQISELSAKIQGRQVDSKEYLEFNGVRAKILQGELNSTLVQFVNLQMQPSKIELSSLSLDELIGFIDVPGLDAEGFIDLIVPMSSSDGQLIVKDAKFQSIGKGVIRYLTGNEQAASEKNIVFQALENFHFESFDGDISYDKEGQYLIKLHLLGSNPEFYDGYPIDFTLNLNGQLSGLFRSLFLTGNFEQAVLDQVDAQRLKTENLQ